MPDIGSSSPSKTYSDLADSTTQAPCLTEKECPPPWRCFHTPSSRSIDLLLTPIYNAKIACKKKAKHSSLVETEADQ